MVIRWLIDFDFLCLKKMKNSLIFFFLKECCSWSFRRKT
jgi:hypothetical protein